MRLLEAKVLMAKRSEARMRESNANDESRQLWRVAGKPSLICCQAKKAERGWVADRYKQATRILGLSAVLKKSARETRAPTNAKTNSEQKAADKMSSVKIEVGIWKWADHVPFVFWANSLISEVASRKLRKAFLGLTSETGEIR